MIIIDSENKMQLLQDIADTAFLQLNLEGDCTVEVDFVDVEQIHELNLATRGVDRATDVLSYPALEKICPFNKQNYPFEYDEETKSVHLGSIVICLTVAAAQAKEYGHSERREQAYLFLHGLLHLLGYDHMTDEEKSEMREAEERVLGKLNLTRE